MKVAILKCDDVLDEFVQEFGNYHDMIIRMFEAAGSQFDYGIFDVQQGQYPERPDDWDFYITTGSKADAWNHAPWVGHLIDFVRRLDRQQRKLIGICFGHQVMAIARHGRVEKSARGWGVGLARNRIVDRPAWMTERRNELNIIVSHRDQVTRPGEGARLVATSDFCPYFVLQWDRHFLGIQGHPEWEAGYARALIEHRRDTLGDELADTALASLSTPPDNLLFTRWILDFIRTGS